ncbi:hydroxyproline-2-epimerase [Xanthomonas phaseoli pv. phaseoli]|uniref:4-hydroxyproline 2-epimerase n=1 Tax=Xanthomonas campestris pv. phaseoli TaxID=317013 RepID=A0AB38DWG9_XANCH|nr:MULTISPECIES: proline racemase family protein [Xanthomonas]ATS21121.1 proline racemase family protein [Xanthomonas phaseoli pv. phaseoli]ATS27795.1 proline racemase family protein [Xanthomonas phaseoli pv. phaseoli]ATS31612.1 proline racemase family protein [Xanthomonas phaseoli pv. phaseoli]ATS36031.1 proline racemase family protein [Xanthomonas phaseoli pv. phaseoli]AZU12959.1 hydroxyproline-2-epimerase [Xanthomonas phaseoli pv. phaseoli]
MHTIDVIDSHTAGEPTRVVLSGFPDLGDGDLAQCRERFRNEFDHWRSAIACEPRGSDTMVGALLLPARDPGACTGVIFFNNVGYLGMCGHGTIGVVRTLAALGRIGPGQHRIETPVGTVGVALAEDGTVSVDNVESYRFASGVEVEVPGHGRVRGDVAWGGNWFFITEHAPCALDLAHQRALTAYTEAIRLALEAAGITGEAGGEIDHIEVNGAAPDGSGVARNFVLCPGLAYDRSPCGTGTSAKLACLAADGKLAEGERWVQQGILGSAFEGNYRLSGRGIAPRISGRAYITARAQLVIDPADPFAWGIVA